MERDNNGSFRDARGQWHTPHGKVQKPKRSPRPLDTTQGHYFLTLRPEVVPRFEGAAVTIGIGETQRTVILYEVRNGVYYLINSEGKRTNKRVEITGPCDSASSQRAFGDAALEYANRGRR